MVIAITGASGFIGRRVVELALGRGHSVRALVREPKRFSEIPGAEVVAWNADSGDLNSGVLAGVEAVCHAAAYIPSSHSVATPDVAQRCFAVNVAGTIRLLQEAEAARVSRFVNLSAGNAYASGSEMPDERWPLFPSARSPLYLASKVAQETIVEHWGLTGRISSCSLRPSAVYGRGQSIGTLAVIAQRLLTNQEVTLKNGGQYAADFIYVDDVASLALSALESDHAGPVNAGSGVRATLREAVDLLLEIAGADPQLVHSEPITSPQDHGFPALDIRRARREFGFRPRSLREGLIEYVRWLRANGPAGKTRSQVTFEAQAWTKLNPG